MAIEIELYTRQKNSVICGQINLFTGEVEPPKGEPERCLENLWLFDPDFRLVLPEDRAGKEIVIEEGISLNFPAIEGIRNRGQGKGERLEGTGNSNNLTEAPLIFGKRPFIPSKPRVAKAADLAQVIVSGFGVYLGKRSERLQVKISGKVAKDENGSAYEFPFFRISEVVIASRGVSISSDLIEEFSERGIRLCFLDRGGKPYAMLTSPTLTATVESRREQLRAFDDARGLEFARAMVRGKIRNQRHLLLYCGKYLKQANPERYDALAGLARQLRQLELQARKVQGATVSEKRQELLGIEGVAGRLYWQGFKLIVEDKAEFMGREHRGAEDPLNALLNYGYGILYGHMWGAITHAGLEPFAGFLHVDRPGKPSLILDLVEEFRQPVVDRTVIAFVNLSQKIEMKEGLLDEDTRRAIAEKVLERLASTEPYRGQHYQIRSIIQMQARALVSFLRGKAPYKPFSFRW
ncbi:MAG TPA: CRISPR-associated endonuclease Cas1 [Terriglobia bacterium]|nr:CRISPR-associated endonuclease Cas1 [Terriglobia bacterium]